MQATGLGPILDAMDRVGTLEDKFARVAVACFAMQPVRDAMFKLECKDIEQEFAVLSSDKVKATSKLRNVSPEMMADFDHADHLKLCPPRFLQVLEAAFCLLRKSKNVLKTKDYFVPRLSLIFAVACNSCNQSLNLLQTVLFVLFKEVNAPQKLIEEMNLLGITVSVSQGQTICERLSGHHEAFMQAVRDVRSFLFIITKHNLLNGPGSPHIFSLLVCASLCLLSRTDNTFSDEAIQKLSLPPVFEARRQHVAPSAWPGRHRYISNVICAPWARFAHPDSWPSRVVVLLLRLLSRAQVDTCKRFQLLRISGGNFCRLSNDAVARLCTTDDETDAVREYIARLRHFWCITDPLESEPDADPLGPPLPRCRVRDRALSASNRAASKARTVPGSRPKGPRRRNSAPADDAGVREMVTSQVRPPVSSAALPAQAAGYSWTEARHHHQFTQDALAKGTHLVGDNVNLDFDERHIRFEDCKKEEKQEKTHVEEATGRSNTRRTKDTTLFVQVTNLVPTTHLPNEYAQRHAFELKHTDFDISPAEDKVLHRVYTKDIFTVASRECTAFKRFQSGLCTPLHTHTHTHTHAHTYIHTYIHTCIHTYIHTHTHAHIHTHTHEIVNVSLSGCGVFSGERTVAP